MTRCTERVQQLIAAEVKAGSAAIDATMGNGHDTVALARAVGPTGTVWAFDVQEEAVRRTTEHLSAEALLDRCRLIHACHSRMAELIDPSAAHAGFAMAVFNLGYLPGGGKAIVTSPDTTRMALDSAAAMLAAGGHLVVTAYTGHPGPPLPPRAAGRMLLFSIT